MTVANTRDRLNNKENIYRNIYQGSISDFNFKFIWHIIHIWRGSVLKLCWFNLVIWILCYAFISIVYRNVLCHSDYKRSRAYFELIVIYCERFVGNIPITFLIGFYVSQVVSRWWDQFMSLPWPDQLALKLVTFMPGRVSKTNPRWL